jgi:hypothetical protein
MRALVVTVIALVAAVAAQAAPGPPSPVLVTYEQTGGFAGIERGLVVYRSGKMRSEGLAPKVSQLSPARLRALKGALEQANFATLARKYRADVPIADGYLYRVTYTGRTVLVEQGADPPFRLKRVLSLLSVLAHT